MTSVSNPNSAFKTVTDYRKFVDENNIPLDVFPQVKRVFKVALTAATDNIAAGDAVYFTVPSSASLPMYVKLLPITATAAQHWMFAGIADENVTWDSVAAGTQVQGVTIITEGLALANADTAATVSAGSGMAAGTASAPAFGSPVYGTGAGGTAGRMYCGLAVETAAQIPGTELGTALGAIDTALTPDKFPMYTKSKFSGA